MSKKKFMRSLRLQLDKTPLSNEDVEEIVNSVDKENPSSPWWIVVLKVIAYAIGLIVAGYSTASAATLLPWIH